MDEDVLAAMARWPQVPAVAGWLSLDPRGNWRLHPQGDADAGGRGEAITNDRILAFFNRNYAAEADGRWFVQNGPQRVYVRIDGAPLVLRTGGDGATLQTHTGHPVTRIDAWWLDDAGRLFASTNVGPAMIEDRDLDAVVQGLCLPDGSPAADRLADGDSIDALRYPAGGLDAAAPFTELAAADVPARLGFAALPGITSA